MDKKRSILYWILGFIALASCTPESAPDKASNELAAVGYLRKYVAENTRYFSENGRYIDLPDLYRSRPSGPIDYQFFMAWDGHEEAVPLFGYLFASVDPGYASGQAKAARAGLCAYPVDGGNTGDLIVCTFSDPEQDTPAQVDPDSESPPSQWRFYVAEARELRHPPRSWPTDAELDQSFVRLDNATLEQGIDDARQRMADEASSR